MPPLYEYECKACGQRMEQERKTGDRKKPVTCASCKSRRTHLVPSLTTFALMGGGWAPTGYEKKSTQPPKTKTKTVAKKEK